MPIEVRAAKEVILAGGSYNSPQLLQLSGVGSPDLLASLGIEVRHALAGSANLNASTMMIADKASDMIRGRGAPEAVIAG